MQAEQGISVNLGSQGNTGAMSDYLLALKPIIQNGYGYTVDSNNKKSLFYQFNALTLTPASGDPTFNNPFKSDINGQSASNGNYETYDMYVYTQHYGFQSWNPLQGAHNPEAQSIYNTYGDRVLGRMRLKIVVENPKTKFAKPVKSILVDDFTPIKNVSGSAIRGIEPSVTTDGKLMIFNENAIYSGHDGIMYIYSDDPAQISSWSTPKPISSLYTESEAFKAKYPIARSPLKSNLGEVFSAGESVLGAYPWISWEGSEITFMAMHANHPTAAARRAGFSIVGRWTGNKIRHVDGSFNKDDTIGTKSVRLFTSAIGSTSSIWNPFKEFRSPALPYLFEQPSLFLISSNTGEFSEVGFRNFVNGRYVLSLSMNPAMKKLSNLTNIPTTDEADFTKTPDLSANDLNGQLQGGARFPIAQVGSVFDTVSSVGIRGQAIEFPESGSVIVNSKSALAETEFGLSVEFFVKPTASISTYQYLVHKPGSYNVILEKDLRLSFRVFINGKEQTLGYVGQPLAMNEWSHIAFTHDPKSGVLRTYTNAQLIAEKKLEVGLIPNDNSQQLIIGPAGQTSSGLNTIMIIDEFKASNTNRSSVEIADSAGIAYKSREIRENLSDNFSLPSIFSTTQFKYPQEFQLSQKKAQLGAMLFSDVRLSSTGTVSCATCHSVTNQLSDNLIKSIGVSNKALRRHTPVVFNRIFSSTQMWDGRFNSLFNQSAGPLTHADEMGLASLDVAVDKIKRVPGYINLFKEAFGKDVDAELLKSAIAAFQATLVTQNSRADKYTMGDLSVLNESEKNGRALFFGKARCAACHSGVNFSDEQFHNTGFFTSDSDLGRQEITLRESETHSFKTPSLRNVALTAPYMHNGSMATLNDVVNFYITGGLSDRFRDPEIKQLNLSSQEVTDLVAFLKALSSDIKPILNINVSPSLPESCKSNQIVKDGKCIDQTVQLCLPSSTKSCSVTNGTGEQVCNSEGSAYGSCTVKSCNSGYTLQGGSCAKATNPNEAIIRKLYLEILKREVEPAGLAYYLNYMSTGGTELSLRGILQNSDEGKCVNSGGVFSNGKCSCASGKELVSGRCVQVSVSYSANEFDLYQNKSIELADVILYMQNDGNFVVYNKISMVPLWNIFRSGYTCNETKPCHMVFQNDGNLVAYQGSTVIWASGSMGGKKLVYKNTSPFLSILDSTGSTIWSSGY